MKSPTPKRITSILLATTLSVASLGILATPSQAAATNNPINTNSRDAVSTAYTTRFVPGTQSPINWTGTVAGCKAGTQSADSLAKATQSINFYRGLAGLDSITTTAAANTKAQQTALMMQANQTLSHYPPTSWKCYTAAGASGAGTSNLMGGPGGYRISSASEIPQLYMDDPGASNTIAGHRRWIINPKTTTMGIGTTSSYNALTVIGTGAAENRANPDFIPFPNGGYFPQQLEPNGLWSLSSDKGVDFSASTITVKSGTKTLDVKKYPVQNGYGPNTVTFQVSGLVDAVGKGESAYTVTVNNMKKAGKVISHSYTVRLFDGTVKAGTTTPPAPVVNNPSIKSSADVVTIDSKGQLWNYGTLNAKTGSAKRSIGSGWTNFSDIFVTDWNTDGVQDIVGKTKTGQLYVYKGNKTGGFTQQIIGNGGWQNYTIAIGKWKASEKNPSVVARDNKTGALYHYTNSAGVALSTRTLIGNGWNGLTFNILDWDKDGKADIVAKNSAGAMILYRTNGNGAFASESRKTIGAGWNAMNSIKTMTGHDGSGTVGVLARDAAGGLHYYPANKSVWGVKKTLGVGWNGFNIAGN